jgi:hypothetical protein
MVAWGRQSFDRPAKVPGRSARGTPAYFQRIDALYQIPVASNRSVVGCAKSYGTVEQPARLRRRFCARGRQLTSLSRGVPTAALTKGLPRAQKSPFDAVPAASVSQGDFAHPTCSDLTGIRSRLGSKSSFGRHARAGRGHPCLPSGRSTTKTWMAGTSSAMTPEVFRRTHHGYFLHILCAPHG